MSEPSLLCVQTLIVLGSYLTMTGREGDAWTLFGTTIRTAHSLDMHRNPLVLLPMPTLRECEWRQRLWWWLLWMDQHYSTMFARPLGISGSGDCPAPTPTTSNPTELRLGEFVSHFTVITRQVLAAGDISNEAMVDELTQRLSRSWTVMPEALQFDKDWLLSGQGMAGGGWALEVTSAGPFTTAVPPACI